MDKDNVIKDCTVEGYWWGDMLSFSMQYRGVLEHNTVLGGRIAFYENRNSTCRDNLVEDSVGQGIYVGAPSYFDVVVGNITRNSRYSGITIKGGDPGSQNGVVKNNQVLDAQNFGIEVSGPASCMLLLDNLVRNVSRAGLYFVFGHSNGAANTTFEHIKGTGIPGHVAVFWEPADYIGAPWLAATAAKLAANTSLPECLRLLLDEQTQM